MDSRGGNPFSLLQSLELANELVMKGHSLDDWNEVETISIITRKCDNFLHKYRVGLFNQESRDEDFHVIRTHVLQALSFIKAHLSAQETFRTEFASINGNHLTLSEKVVLDESKDQVSKAEALIMAFDAEDVNAIKSQYVCQILLYKAADYFRKLARSGLMSDREAGEFLDAYDKELRQLRSSSELKSEIAYHKMSSRRPSAISLGKVDEGSLDVEDNQDSMNDGALS